MIRFEDVVQAEEAMAQAEAPDEPQEESNRTVMSGSREPNGTRSE